jgi:hypothetical protein
MAYKGVLSALNNERKVKSWLDVRSLASGRWFVRSKLLDAALCRVRVQNEVYTMFKF